MIFDQAWGIFLILLVLGAVISFFSRSLCVTDFYSRGFTTITRRLHRDTNNLQTFYWCGRPVKMTLKLKGKIVGH